ncbi:DUF2285 domain-containing protein [Bradyrhizobium elkanii]|jgi:hypothetical protein|uniref:DUF2285 domain-containing protein n=1 Tax=Bradyrhizobium elkanii TaxID=29448 RepID=UPI00209FF41D|nr:DUF2285 domain-containing protein [Bradyrhizobium elkanii]MCP1931041.1 hypothetical protein [Bradyrhizobium elkanii]
MPEIDPGTVILTAPPSALSVESAAAAIDLASARVGPDGLSGFHGRGADTITILVAQAPPTGTALVALVPLGPDGLDRIEAVTRLWRALNYRRVPPDTRLTAQQRRRIRNMIQAVDGHTNGATYREIAVALFGAARVADTPWKTSALRDATIDLVRDGLSLVAGGYRSLLRRRRRS